MRSISESDWTSVKTKTKEMVETMKLFRQQDVDDYYRITEIGDIRKSKEYYRKVECRRIHLIEKVNSYERKDW